VAELSDTSVHEKAERLNLARRVLMREWSSVMCTALIAVLPAVSGSSVNAVGVDGALSVHNIHNRAVPGGPP